MKNITFINAGAGSGKTYRLTEELYEAINNKECKAHEVMLTTFTKKAAEEIRVKAREKLLEKGKFSEANDLQNAYIGTVHAVGQNIIQKFWHYIGFPKEIRVMDEDDTDFYFTQAIAEVPNKTELNRLNILNYKFNPLNSYRTLDVNKWKNDLLAIIGLARTNHIQDFKGSINSSLAYAKKVFNSKSESLDCELIVPIIEKIIKIGNELPEKGNLERIKKANTLKKIKIDNIQYSQLKSIKVVIDDFQKKGLIGDEVSKVSGQLEDYHRSITLINDIEEYNKLLFDIAKRSIEEYAKYKQEIGLIDYSDMENGFLKLLEFEDVKSEISKTIKLVMVDEFQDSSPIQLAIFIKLSEIVDRSIWVGDPKQSIYSFRGTDPVLIDAIVTKFEQNQDESLLTDNLEDSWRSRPEIVECVNKIFKPALKSQVKEESVTLNAVRTNKGFNKTALHHFNFVENKEDKNGNIILDSTNPTYYKSLAKGIVKILSEEWVVSDKNKSEPNKTNKEKERVVTNSIKAKDIAILCKTNDDVNDIAKELNNFGVKVSSESNSLKETAEYFLIISLIKLILSQSNTLAKAEVKVLTEIDYDVADLIDDRLDFINKLPKLPIEPVENEYSNEDFEIVRKKYIAERTGYFDKLNTWGNDNLLIKSISSLFNELRELPIPQLIEHIVNRLNIYSLVTSWGNAEQRQNNLQKIIEYAYKYDNRCINMNLGASIAGFIYYLHSQESLTESKAENEDAVNVLTYHKSKGLEWPLVVLANLNKDVDWGFIARNIFGVYIKNKPGIDLKNILNDRSIISLPWIFGTQNSTISNDFSTYLEATEEYKDALRNHHNELKRVLYVGMTRPRDYMITTGISGQRTFPWMTILNKHGNWKFEEAANVESGKADIFDRGISFEVHKLQLSDDDKIETNEVNQYFSGKKINPENSMQPYFISPSKVKNDVDPEVSIYADVQNRIPTGSSAKDRVDKLGNCLHDILYLYLGNKLTNETDYSLKSIEKIIMNHNMDSIISANEVLISIDKLYLFLKEKFNPVVWFRELPLECEIDRQLYKGEADLVLETTDGYILIDYKSYPGSIDRVLDASSINSEKSNYAGIYSGQLNTYAKMIETVSNKKVIKKLIYYVIQGKIVELK